MTDQGGYQTPMREQIEKAKAAMREQLGEMSSEEREIPLTDLLNETSELKKGSNKNQYALGEQYQLGDFSQTHEAILNFLLVNPGTGAMTRCAKAFGVSNAWLSTLVHSDLFQAKLRNRNDEYFSSAIQPLQERLVGAAHATLDRLEGMIDEIEDPKLLTDLMDKLCHRLGYAPKSGIVVNAPISQQNNVFQVTPALLEQARLNAQKGGNNEQHKPAPEGLQDNERTVVGEVVDDSPEIPSLEEKAS